MSKKKKMKSVQIMFLLVVLFFTISSIQTAPDSTDYHSQAEHHHVKRSVKIPYTIIKGKALPLVTLQFQPLDLYRTF